MVFLEMKLKKEHHMGLKSIRSIMLKKFEMLNEEVSDHKNITIWIKAHAKTKNGRAAWETFKEHFRGMNQMEAIEANAEKQLASLVYRGEKPRYNFETHVSKHLRAHLDIEKAGGEMRERAKVRKLLDSIQVSFLNAAVATVRANDGLLESFDKTVSYLRTFIIATDQVETRNVSSVQGNGTTKKCVHFEENTKKNKNKKGKTNNNGDDRYYKPNEWWALSQEKRDSILAKRKLRKSQTSAVSTESTTQEDKQVSSVQTSQRR